MKSIAQAFWSNFTISDFCKEASSSSHPMNSEMLSVLNALVPPAPQGSNPSGLEEGIKE